MRSRGGKPYFSILIPTKGRVEHTRFALESLRNQTFTDFEVFLLDSDPSSKTAQAYFGGWQSWLDGRFHYLRTGDVWMSQNLESGLAHVRGEVLHVCQDKAVMACDALELAHAFMENSRTASLVFELVSHTWGPGNHRFLDDGSGMRAEQLQPQFSYGSGIQVIGKFVDSRQVIFDFLSDGWETICFEAPRAFNCFTRLDVITASRSRNSPFFGNMSPDLYSALVLLDQLDGFHRTNAQLASHFYGSEVSFGTNWRYKFGYAVDAFAAFEPKVLAHMVAMPLGLTPLFHNGIFGDYVNARAHASKHLVGTRLSAAHYFTKVMQDIAKLHEIDELKVRLSRMVQRRQADFLPESI